MSDETLSLTTDQVKEKKRILNDQLIESVRRFETETGVCLRSIEPVFAPAIRGKLANNNIVYFNIQLDL